VTLAVVLLSLLASSTAQALTETRNTAYVYNT
jgi:hypothetical protein